MSPSPLHDSGIVCSAMMWPPSCSILARHVWWINGSVGDQCVETSMNLVRPSRITVAAPASMSTSAPCTSHSTRSTRGRSSSAIRPASVTERIGRTTPSLSHAISTVEPWTGPTAAWMTDLASSRLSAKLRTPTWRLTGSGSTKTTVEEGTWDENQRE